MRIGPANTVDLEPSWRPYAGAGPRARAAGNSVDNPGAHGHERGIYAGAIGREQAARGAVMGQYVRMAQLAQEQSLPQPSAGAEGGRQPDSAAHFLRRDLLNAMMLYMTGGLGSSPTGTQLCDCV